MGDPPQAPADAPQYVVDGLARQPPELLVELSRYADQLAAHKRVETVAATDDQDDADGPRGKYDPDDLDLDRDDVEKPVPARAYISVKEISDNHYAYWQWKEDGTVKSVYAGPVTPED